MRGAFQTYCDVAEFGKDLKVTPRAAAKIEDGERPFTLDVLQQRRDVLANVVIASALPEIFGILVVTVQCELGYFFEVLRLLVDRYIVTELPRPCFRCEVRFVRQRGSPTDCSTPLF